MKRLPRILAAAAFLALSIGASAAVVYRPAEGWQVENSDGGTPAGSANAQLNKAQRLENDDNLKGALGAYRLLVRRWPKSLVAPQAQLKIGELYERTGDLSRSFDAYGVYLSKFPRGDDFERAVEAQFKIARLYLDSGKKRMLGVPVGSAMPRAQQMFETIVKNAPFSRYAPLSQFNIGQTLEKQGKYPEAIAAYQTVLIKYPTDPVAADAQYQIGYVYYQEDRAGRDATASDNAREAFDDFIARYPTSEKVAQAQENLKTLTGKQSKGALEIAKFYDKQKKYKAAVVYYNEVIKQQPGSKESDEAKARIDELKDSVGEDVLKPGPERTETGARAQVRRRLQARVETSSRPDYLGPPVIVPDEVAPQKPKPRTSPGDVGSDSGSRAATAGIVEASRTP